MGNKNSNKKEKYFLSYSNRDKYEGLFSLMVINILVIGMKIRNMELEPSFLKMAISMLVNGEIMKKTVLEHSTTRQEISI